MSPPVKKIIPFAIGGLLLVPLFVHATEDKKVPISDTQTEISAKQTILDAQFKDSVEQLLPLSPEQIQAFKEKMWETERAIRPGKPPTLGSCSKRLTLKPGDKINIVEIVPGYVSSIVIYDSSGAPWPVTSVTNGNSKWFSVVKPEVEPGNLITVSTLTKFANSNIVLTLKEHDMPVVIQLKTSEDQKPKDALIAFQLDRRGPFAKDPIIGKMVASSINETMLSFIDGIPPQGSVRMEMKPLDGNSTIWKLRDQLYLCTNKALVWPAWSQIASGTNGYRVYKIPMVPSILLSRNGQVERLNIKKGPEN